MEFEEMNAMVNELILSSKLDTHETNISDNIWFKKVQNYTEAILKFQNVMDVHSCNFNPPSSEFLIFIGGIIGNCNSSYKLHFKDELRLLTTELLNKLLIVCNVDSVRKLLLLQPRKSKSVFSNLGAQFVHKCVFYFNQCSSSECKDDPSVLCPLIRDALIWLTYELDYPELSDDEFISVLQPFGLRLTEDYRPHIQLIGLRVLRVLASKTRIADWRYSNRAVAVVSQLFEHRIACSSTSSESLLDELYLTLFELVSLLQHSTAHEWYNKLCERILFDLDMETRKSRQHVLLVSLEKILEIMEASFALHSRNFIRVVSNILLGPRVPVNIRLIQNDQSANERAVYLLVLQCVYKFATFVWPLASPYLLPDLIPPLVAFVDLESNETPLSKEPNEVDEMLSKIFKTFVQLESRLLTDVLQPLCSTVPRLEQFLQ